MQTSKPIKTGSTELLATLPHQSISPSKVNGSSFTTITKRLKEFKCNPAVFNFFSHNLLVNWNFLQVSVFQVQIFFFYIE